MTVIGTDTGAGITVGTHSRASFTTTTAGNITGFRVIGGDTAGATNLFALTEISAGIEAVPERESSQIYPKIQGSYIRENHLGDACGVDRIVRIFSRLYRIFIYEDQTLLKTYRLPL